MRVHELAKELGLSSKELLARLREAGHEVKSHMSAIDDAAVAEFRAKAKGDSPAEADAAKPAAEKPAKAKAAAKKPAAKKSKPESAPEPPAAPAPAAPAPPAAAVKKPAAAPPPPARRQAPPPKPPILPPATPHVTPPPKSIKVRGPIVVRELAERLDVRPNKLVSELMQMNILASINERLEVKIAEAICKNHGYTLDYEKRGAPPTKPPVRKALREEEKPPERAEDMESRPPIVTFLGHVDHGKTSLLDHIRTAKVADGEAGGITQHIGAYTVKVGEQTITFIDTPGHEAFTAMRSRGATVTDIAVIVIAADDGIMPQTREAIEHAQRAEVALMVAINKCDLPAASPDRVKQQLQQMELSPEDWGGDVICVQVSAKTGEGMDELLEMINLQAEILELRANSRTRAQGVVLEAELESGRGAAASLLVTSGTLKVGDAVRCGPYWGRVRALIDDRGQTCKSAGPATPVKCLGLSGVPEAGNHFVVCKNDRLARSQAEEYEDAEKLERLQGPARPSAVDLYEQLDAQEKQEYSVILKADVQGSLQAVEDSLLRINSEKIGLNIVDSGVGNVTVNDVSLASVSNADIISFNVGREGGVVKAIKSEKVKLSEHTIIYELIEEVRREMLSRLAPLQKQHIVGHAEVKQLFTSSRSNTVAGCLVLHGQINTTNLARVKRNGTVVHDGKISSLRRFKDEVNVVRETQECGVCLTTFSDFEELDIIEAYELEEVAQTL